MKVPDLLKSMFPRLLGRPPPSSELIAVYYAAEDAKDSSRKLGERAEQLATRAAQIGDYARQLREAYSGK